MVIIAAGIVRVNDKICYIQMEIEGLLRQELDTRTLEAFGGEGGGNVCKGQAYRVDGGNIYVKINTGPGVS